MSGRRIVYFGYGSLVNRDTRPPEETAACARLRGWRRRWGHGSVARDERSPSCSLTIEPIPGGVSDGIAGGGALVDADGHALGAGVGGAGVGGAGADGADVDRAGVDRAGVDRAGVDGAGIDRAGIGSAGVYGAGADSVDVHGAGSDVAAVDGAGIDGVIVALPLEALPALDAREAGYERLTLPAALFDLPEGLGADEIHVYRSKVEHRLPPTPARPILQSYVDCVLVGYLRVYGEGGLDAFVRSTEGWDGAIEDDRAAPRYPRAVDVPGSLRARFDRLIAVRRAV